MSSWNPDVLAAAREREAAAIVRQLVDALWGWQLYAEEGGVNLDDYEEGGLFRDGDAALTAARAWLEQEGR